MLVPLFCGSQSCPLPLNPAFSAQAPCRSPAPAVPCKCTLGSGRFDSICLLFYPRYSVTAQFRLPSTMFRPPPGSAFTTFVPDFTAHRFLRACRASSSTVSLDPLSAYCRRGSSGWFWQASIVLPLMTALRSRTLPSALNCPPVPPRGCFLEPTPFPCDLLSAGTGGRSFGLGSSFPEPGKPSLFSPPDFFLSHSRPPEIHLPRPCL